MLPGLLLTLVLVGILMTLLVAVLHRALKRRTLRTWTKREHNEEKVTCARCGYDLRGLEIPRCPECGTLRGFEVPLVQLGLTEQEIQDAHRRKRERKT
ncbi:MAG: hypothetical protein MI923_06360 [Phycisphaerales bacterium]|nr:hypothetical protein [Phycisphaerales bacterium]